MEKFDTVAEINNIVAALNEKLAIAKSQNILCVVSGGYSRLLGDDDEQSIKVQIFEKLN